MKTVYALLFFLDEVVSWFNEWYIWGIIFFFRGHITRFLSLRPPIPILVRAD